MLHALKSPFQKRERMLRYSKKKNSFSPNTFIPPAGSLGVGRGYSRWFLRNFILWHVFFWENLSPIHSTTHQQFYLFPKKIKKLGPSSKPLFKPPTSHPLPPSNFPLQTPSTGTPPLPVSQIPNLEKKGGGERKGGGMRKRQKEREKKNVGGERGGVGLGEKIERWTRHPPPPSIFQKSQTATPTFPTPFLVSPTPLFPHPQPPLFNKNPNSVSIFSTIPSPHLPASHFSTPPLQQHPTEPSTGKNPPHVSRNRFLAEQTTEVLA